MCVCVWVREVYDGVLIALISLHAFVPRQNLCVGVGGGGGGVWYCFIYVCVCRTVSVYACMLVYICICMHLIFISQQMKRIHHFK